MSGRTPAEIGHEIRTQDNAATANPIFGVRQRRRVWGVNHDYTDTFGWVNVIDAAEADDDESADLEARYREDGAEPRGWRRVGYIDTWEFVTACLTAKGCEDFIAINGHNLTDPRIYVYGGYRNHEWATVREHFAALSALPSPGGAR